MSTLDHPQPKRTAPGAPTNQLIPLPATRSASPTIVPMPPARNDDCETNVSYASLTKSERSVWMRKHNRFKDWAQEVTGLGGVMTPESHIGRAAGAGSAQWSDTASGQSRRVTLYREDTRVGGASSGLEVPTAKMAASNRGAIPIVAENAIPHTSGSRGEPAPLSQARCATTSRIPFTTARGDVAAVRAASPRSATRPDVMPPAFISPPGPLNNVPAPGKDPSRLGSAVPLPRERAPSQSPNANLAIDARSASLSGIARAPSARRLVPKSHLARPTSQAYGSMSTLHIDRPSSPAPGDLLSPYPHNGITRAQRDAYISSALSLPLDMLAETSDVPATLTTRNSSRLSGVRLRSLLSQRSPRQDPVSVRAAGCSTGVGPRPGETLAPWSKFTAQSKVPGPSGRGAEVANLKSLPTNSATPGAGRTTSTDASLFSALKSSARSLSPSTTVPTPNASSALGVSGDHPIVADPHVSSPSLAPLANPGVPRSTQPRRVSSSATKGLAAAEDHVRGTVQSRGAHATHPSAVGVTHLVPLEENLPVNGKMTGGSGGKLGSGMSRRLQRGEERNGPTSDIRRRQQLNLDDVGSSGPAAREATSLSEPVKTALQVPGRPRAAEHVQEMSSTTRLPSSAGTENRRDPLDVPNTNAPRPPTAATTATTSSVTLAHRQQRSTLRPALSRNGSSLNPAGRVLRQPSLSNLRFDPATYPLPASITSPEGSTIDAVLSDELQVSSAGVKLRSRIVSGSANPGATDVVMAAQKVPVGTAPTSQLENEQPPPDQTRDRHPDSPSQTVSAQVGQPQVAGTRSGTFTPLSFDERRPEPTRAFTVQERASQTSPWAPPTPSTPAIVVSPAQPVDIGALETEHLSFEVPSGHRGRLRVTLAWFKDGSRSTRRNPSEATSTHMKPRSPQSPRPPPVPPKSPLMGPHKSLAGRVRDHFSPRGGRRSLEGSDAADHDAQRAGSLHGSRHGPRVGRALDGEKAHRASDWERESECDRQRQADRDRRDRQREEDLDRQSRARSPVPMSPPIIQPAYHYWNGTPAAVFSSTALHNVPPQYFPYAQYSQPNPAYPQPAVPGVRFDAHIPGSKTNRTPGIWGPANVLAARNRASGWLGSQAPPSPPRPPSIDPPSDRGSPPIRPGVLPPFNVPPSNMMGMDGIAATAASTPAFSTAWQGPWSTHQPAPVQQGQGRFARFLDRQPKGGREENDTGNIARWRRGVKRDNIQNSISPLARTKGFLGKWARQRDDEDERRWQRFFAQRRVADPGPGIHPGWRADQQPAIMPPVSSAMGLGLGSIPRPSNGIPARTHLEQPRYDLYEAQLRQAKELRRREKIERRARRAERKRDLRTADARRTKLDGTTSSTHRLADMMPQVPGADRAGAGKTRRRAYQAQPTYDGARANAKAGQQRRYLPGLGVIRGSVRGRNDTAAVTRPDAARDRTPRLVQDWVAMFRPTQPRATPKAYPQPAAKISGWNMQGGERAGQTDDHYKKARGEGRGLPRDVLGTKKWSDRAKANRRR